MRKLLVFGMLLAAARARAEGDAATQLQKQLDAPGRRVAAYVAEPVKGAGKISGTVTLAGAAPQTAPIPHTKDQSICGATGADESLLLGENGAIANAIVTLDLPKGKKLELPKDATLDQKQCAFSPHIQALPIGTPLAVVNSDPLLHNVHSYKDDTTIFNAAEPLQGQRKVIPLKTAGLLRVRCDVHGWMNAFIFVADNPYFAVTGKDGSFSIDGVPPGTYKMHVWQERLAPKDVEVTVTAGATAKADVKLSAP